MKMGEFNHPRIRWSMYDNNPVGGAALKTGARETGGTHPGGIRRGL